MNDSRLYRVSYEGDGLLFIDEDNLVRLHPHPHPPLRVQEREELTSTIMNLVNRFTLLEELRRHYVARSSEHLDRSRIYCVGTTLHA